MSAQVRAHGATASVLFLATSLLGGWLCDPAHGQADRVTRTIVSGTVLDLDGQPVAGAVVGYATAEEIKSVMAPRRLVLLNGRRQMGAEQPQGITAGSTSIRREGHATLTVTTTSTEFSAEAITSDAMRRLGLTTADMSAQLPSNAGTFQPDDDRDVNQQWLIHPSGIAFVDGRPAGETDDTGTFSVELPGGGTYVITAKSESPNSRGYGSRQPVVVKTGQTLLLPPIMLSLAEPQSVFP